jgi:hypothetical protein
MKGGTGSELATISLGGQTTFCCSRRIFLRAGIGQNDCWNLTAYALLTNHHSKNCVNCRKCFTLVLFGRTQEVSREATTHTNNIRDSAIFRGATIRMVAAISVRKLCCIYLQLIRATVANVPAYIANELKRGRDAWTRYRDEGDSVPVKSMRQLLAATGPERWLALIVRLPDGPAGQRPLLTQRYRTKS